MEELGIDNRHQAYQALRGILHALRDRLPVEEATHLGAQLPMLITGIYYEGWEPEDKPERIRHGEAFGGQSEDSERAARAVFNILARRTSEGEIKDITGHFTPGPAGAVARRGYISKPLASCCDDSPYLSACPYL